jgi:YidC/Oxa1 family membrane protein insertase
MVSNLFHILIYKPLYNSLIFLINIIPGHDLGIAIIILTFAVRLIVWPLTHRSITTQRKIKELEPEISKIKRKFKKDRQEQTKKIMELYKIHGISPFSGFLLLFIQFPILIALYSLLRKGVEFRAEDLYSFISLPAQIKVMFLGLIDTTKPDFWIAGLAGLSQFFQIKFSYPKGLKGESLKTRTNASSFRTQLQRSMSFQMKYIMPLFIFWIAYRFSSGLALYWTTSNIFAILHEVLVSRKNGNKKIKNGKSDSNNQRNNRNLGGQNERGRGS